MPRAELSIMLNELPAASVKRKVSKPKTLLINIRAFAAITFLLFLATGCTRMRRWTVVEGSRDGLAKIVAMYNVTGSGDNGTELPLALPADGTPRAIISHACSGSSATITFTKMILEAHGYNVFAGGRIKLKKLDENSIDVAKQRLEANMHRMPTNQELLADTFVYYNKRAIKDQKIFLFKVGSIGPEVMETLKELGTNFTYTYRSNLLDRAICTVRDCFEYRGKFGDQVYVNGTKANTCFDRRKHSKEKVMAHFNDIEALIMLMHAWENEHNEHIRTNLHHTEVSTYEDLFKFEYTANEEVFDDSVKTWCAFLRTFGEIKEHIVENFLRTYKNTRPPRPPYNETVYNLDEIKRYVEQYLSE